MWYDRYGEQTFQGEAALEYVELGENRPLTLALHPIGKGERAEAMFTLAGEEHAPEGLRLVIEADRKEVGEGQSAILRAYGIDAKGQKLELDPQRLNWSIGDPRLGRFDLDPLKPRDPNNWMKFNAIRFLEDARPEHDVFVTWGVAVGFVRLVLFRNPFVDISAGADVTCGVRLLGDLSCWGSNERSMLASAACSYGISAFCWGKNDLGQLGVRTSTTTLSTSPIAVAPPAGFPTPLAFRSISAGGGITCGIITERFDRNRRLLLPVE